MTVTDPGGKVIGSATLGSWSHQRVSASGITAYTCVMPFTMTSVPTEARYGFAINNVPGKIWVTHISKPVILVVGDTSGSGG